MRGGDAANQAGRRWAGPDCGSEMRLLIAKRFCFYIFPPKKDLKKEEEEGEEVKDMEEAGKVKETEREKERMRAK